MFRYLLFYLLIINIVGGIMFWFDKYKATKKSYRTPEKTLHTMEALGSVFVILFLMYFIRHKNQKKSYYVLTYLILCGWCILLSFV